MNPRVGDMIRFGQSSRRYIVTGSPEFLPEEGPNKEQRRQLVALEVGGVLFDKFAVSCTCPGSSQRRKITLFLLLKAMALRKEREAAIAKTQMESALNGGANWGFQEDAVAEPSDLGQSSLWFFLLLRVLMMVQCHFTCVGTHCEQNRLT